MKRDGQYAEDQNRAEEKKCKQIEFAKEEYKILFEFGVRTEDRMLQVFSGTVTISVTLLSAIGGYLLKEDRPVTAAEAYIALAPILMILPSFLLLVGMRRDMARIGAYVHVFFEEFGILWPKHLIAFRLRGGSFESLDTIPIAYCSLVIACFGIFFCLLYRSRIDQLPHACVLVVAGCLLVAISKRWRRAVSTHFEDCIVAWREVKSVQFEM